MIIPIRCFTCNKVLADLWEYYKKKDKEIIEKAKERETEIKKDSEFRFFSDPYIMNERQKLMKELNVTRLCCRKNLLTNVDIIDNM